MGSIPWKGLTGALLAIVATAVWIAPEPVAERLATAPTPQLIHYLASERQPVWQAAVEEMLKRGSQSVPTCAAALGEAPPELRLRLFHVLEQSFLSSDPETFELASEVLEGLQRGSRLELSLPADRILSENAPLRTSRALYAIEQLGGEFRLLSADRARESARLGLILLDRRWRGGDAGLNHIMRLKNAAQMHVSAEAGVSAAAISELTQKLPRLHVVTDGQGCLGVEGEATRFGFVVRGVGSNSPADRGGIRPEDTIVDVDDDVRANADSLPQRVARFVPGTLVRLHVRRRQTRLAVTVELGDAFGTGNCTCQRDPVSPASSAAASPDRIRAAELLGWNPAPDAAETEPEQSR